ncbi:hypothetical protein Pcinc_043951 [Petrolisthes cinctipes]|uniref:Uncharacterized protein n=1 Tax=Petrolisthes cinctipes TaxID=88211 RepID=A0AAE1EFT6_PETCI|nr:hypothetical protein Pcinc_043951 [Petrolisthes cinctipes]
MISGRLRHHRHCHRHHHHRGCVAGGGCFDIWPPPSPPSPPWRLCGGWRLLRYLAASVTTVTTMEAVWRVAAASISGRLRHRRHRHHGGCVAGDCGGVYWCLVVVAAG